MALFQSSKSREAPWICGQHNRFIAPGPKGRLLSQEFPKPSLWRCHSITATPLCSPPAGNSTPPHMHFFKAPSRLSPNSPPNTCVSATDVDVLSAPFCQSFTKFFCCLSSEGVGKHSGKQTHTQTLLGDTLWARPRLPVWFIYSHPKKTNKQKKRLLRMRPSVSPLGFMTSEWGDPLVTTLFSVLAWRSGPR